MKRLSFGGSEAEPVNPRATFAAASMHKMASGIGQGAKIADAIANAAVDPSRWNEAMEVTAQASGAVGALLLPLRNFQ